MKKEHFVRLMDFLSVHSGLRDLLCRACTLLPAVIMVIYPVIVLFLLLVQGNIPWPQILCPALTLAGTVVLRRLFPRPRPFEVFAFSPLMSHRPGGSFPSRHSASALAIALTAFAIHSAAGVVLIILAVLIGATRMLTGLHFPRDILGGYALALLIGIPGLFLL